MPSEESLSGSEQPTTLCHGRRGENPPIALSKPSETRYADRTTYGEEDPMGIFEDAKEVADTAGRKVKEAAADLGDKVGDKVDELKADANLKKAEAEKESVEKKNDLKEKLRD